MTKKRAVAARGRWRVFTAKFKREMVRQFDARRAQRVEQAQIALELNLRTPMLQSWVHTLARQPDRSAPDVFP